VLFQRATKKCNPTFLLFHRATKKCDCTIPLLKWANVQNCAKKGWILKLHFFCTLKRSHNCSFDKGECVKMCKKVEIPNHTFFLLLKKGDCTFSMIALFKVQKSTIPKFVFFALFQRTTKSAIAHSHIFKEWRNVRSHIRTFSKSENVLCAIVRLPLPAVCYLERGVWIYLQKYPIDVSLKLFFFNNSW